MKEYISFDSHKHYTLAEKENVKTGAIEQQRIEHRKGAIYQYLKGRETGKVVAVEAIGNWYWIVDEIEKAGAKPLLVHPRKAKLMMGMINKTDKLDVHGLNRLQRNGTLPTVWIAPPELRDLRELTRVRMVMSRRRTDLKNRLSSIFSKYALELEDYKDRYAKKARGAMEAQMKELPEQSAWSARVLLGELDRVEICISEQEKRVRKLIEETPEMKLLMSSPGIGIILAAVIYLELGDIRRFATAEKLASYSGTTPRVHSSGGKTRMGSLRQDVNQYLKWAFAEAANSIAVNHLRCPDRHVSRLYKRLRNRKGHAKAVGAVARHLAEAVFYILSRKEPYREPILGNLGRCKREKVMSP